jgi:septal ring factor EnvC (AmiA/AmiB activator)
VIRAAALVSIGALLVLARPLLADEPAPRPAHIVTSGADALPFVLQLGPAGLARSHAARIAETANHLAWNAPAAHAARQVALDAAATTAHRGVLATNGYRARPGAFEALRGALPLPAPDVPILAGFGLRPRTTSQTVARHTGITFAPAPEAPVLAVADGICVHAGLIEGFGVVVLLQHQDGYMTVYANLSRALVNHGHPVSAGEPLGETGAASSFGEDGLYFELRELGVPIDPAGWLQPGPTGSGRGTSR